MVTRLELLQRVSWWHAMVVLAGFACSLHAVVALGKMALRKNKKNVKKNENEKK